MNLDHLSFLKQQVADDIATPTASANSFDLNHLLGCFFKYISIDCCDILFVCAYLVCSNII